MFLERLRNLYPGYFAMSMATGIISVGALLCLSKPVAMAFLGVEIAVYALLATALCFRLVLFGPRVLADLRDHWRGAGFFTVPAATAVLGTSLSIVAGADGASRILLYLALPLWAVVMFGFFGAMVVGEDQVDIDRAINGAWLTSVVSTQSIAILTLQIASSVGAVRLACGFIVMGTFLYFLLIAAIFYRLVIHPVRPSDLTPTYWVNSGAAAISSLALSRLALALPAHSETAWLTSFATGCAMVFWVIASWWIPLLLLLGFWKHVLRRFPLQYDPRYWSTVFPMGMYAVSTKVFIGASNFGELGFIPMPALTLAMAAWALGMLGALNALRKLLIAAKGGPSALGTTAGQPEAASRPAAKA